MKPEQQIKQILIQMEQLVSNIKEIRHNNRQTPRCNEIIELEMSLSNAFRCVEGQKDD